MNTRPAVAPLRSVGFRRYLAGQLPSVTCSWAQVVALSWAVVDRDPGALGWVVTMQFLPSLLLGPWFGTVADRQDRRRLLMLAEAGLGLVALAYAVGSVLGVLTMPAIYALATCWGVLNALDTPARRALVPMLVAPEHAARASGLTGTVLLLGMTAGSALGGTLVATAGITVVFVANALSFLGDVAVLSTIHVGASPQVRRAPRQIREGLGYVWHTPALRAPLLALAVVGTLGFTVQVSVPVLMRAGFGGGASLIGAAFTAVTAGSLAGALVTAARGASGPRTVRHTAGGMAAAMALTAVAPSEPVALAGLAGVGLAWSILLGSVIATLQSAEPPMMGRVMSLFAVVLLGGNAAGGPVAAALAATAGPRAPFALGALAAVTAAAVAGMERRRPPGPPGRGATTVGPRPSAVGHHPQSATRQPADPPDRPRAPHPRDHRSHRAAGRGPTSDGLSRLRPGTARLAVGPDPSVQHREFSARQPGGPQDPGCSGHT